MRRDIQANGQLGKNMTGGTFCIHLEGVTVWRRDVSAYIPSIDVVYYTHIEENAIRCGAQAVSEIFVIQHARILLFSTIRMMKGCTYKIILIVRMRKPSP